MASPQWDQFRTAILQSLGSESPLTLYQLYDLVPGIVGLTEEEMQETIPSGQPRYKNRIGWMATYLVKAGAVTRTKRATFAITERGYRLLSEGGPITDDRLKQFPEFVDFLHGTKGGSSEVSTANTSDSRVDETPEEAIQRAHLELRAVIEAELLSKLRVMPWRDFERLVTMHVLRAMGYGKDGSLNVTQATNDGGVDGIISQDPLGLDRIYVQVKRFDESTVHSPDIHKFMGALMSHHGDRGVFVTTSTFSKSAIQTAEASQQRIQLVDGERLARLMVTYEVGVQVTSRVPIYQLDEDFFEEF